MKKLLLSAFTLLASCYMSTAQVSAYTFTQSTGAYSAITGGSVIAVATGTNAAGTIDDAVFNLPAASFPFTFTYNGIGYTGCNISSNGFITFGATAPGVTNTTPISGAGLFAGSIAAWGGDLNSMFSAGTASLTGEIRYEVVGSTPNREVVIQYSNWRPSYSTSTTNIYGLNFQIRLEETTNKVSVVYGSNGYVLGSTNINNTRQIGLRGATNADYNNRLNGAAVSFTASTAGTGNGSVQTFSTTGTTPGMPVNGLMYSWAPPLPCSGTPTAGNATSTSTVLCAASNVTLNLTGSTTGVTGLSYQWLSSPDGISWNPIPTATTTATTQSVTATTYYQCAVACGTNVATSSTITVNFGTTPNAGITAATSTMVCPNQPINLSLTGASSIPGLTYQWQSSPTGTGYTAIVPTASLATTTQTITADIYFQNVLTCGSFTAASAPIQVMVAGTTTNTVPYFEGFEGITQNNQLPNCSWMATSPGTICLTYTATPVAPTYNRLPKSGTKFGSFRWSTAATGDYFYTNGIQLTAGVNYQASADYITDGANGWSEFRLLYGAAQSTTGLTSIAAATGTLTNTTYNNLLGTFSVSTTGLYYSAVKAIGNGTPWYLTFDDLKVEVAPSCIAPTAYNNTGITSTSATFTWTAGGAETAWDVFVGSNPTGTTVPTATTSVTSYTATGLTVGNTYSVYVRANCGGTNSAWVLSTASINYCTPAPSSVDGSGITNVTIPTGINNTTTAEVGNYGNYSVQTATVFQGTTVPVNITYATGYTYDTKVWIDFNDDLDFNDVGEEVYSGASLATNPTTLAASFNLALAAPLGVHRLRIGGLDVGPPTPCYSGTWGSYEDYSINIEPAPACTLTPAIGSIVGQSTLNIGTPGSFSVTSLAGNIQWYQGTTATGPWTAVTSATTNPSNITFSSQGTIFVLAIASNPGCVNDTTNSPWQVFVNFPGDNVCSAIPLTLGVSTTSYSPVGATTQTGEVSPPNTGYTSNTGWGQLTLANTLWFTFVAPASGYVTVQAPDFDTQVAIWKAATCSDLLSASTATLIAANDDDSAYVSHSGVQFSSFVRAACLTPGATYYIQLDSYDTPALAGSSTRVLVMDMGAPLNMSFTGLAANYCLPASSSSLTPASPYGVFTVNTSTTAITSFSPSSVGTNTVMYSLFGCMSNSTTVVANTPSVNASTSSASICAGSSATLTAGGATNYTWTAAGTSSTQIVTPSSASVYTVTGEASGCSNTATVSVRVNNLPTVSATASNTLVCANLGESAVLTASTAATSYTWSDGANTMTTSVTPTVGTTYTLTVNDGNCEATTTVFVDVQTCTGINTLASVSNGINIYPNPTNGILNIAISSELAGNTSIEVYDALGKLVVKETLTNETTTINTSKLTDGMYVYKVINNNKAIKIGKIVKH
ncbi:MAG: T9SS type A sorting domain-containing protein [Bacteroidetes bacterium]|nr:T9SS type A sorting domain-containing protein [Bacteroidota bacterium]